MFRVKSATDDVRPTVQYLFPIGRRAMTSSCSDVMPRLRLIGRCCDVIILVVLLSLGAVFLTRYAADVTRRRNSRDFPAAGDVTSENGKSPGESLGESVPGSRPTAQTTDDVIGRIPDRRPEVCLDRKYDQVGAAMATVVVVFSDYEFYDARLTLSTILRDAELTRLVSEILLIDDASNHEPVLQVVSAALISDAEKRIMCVHRGP